MIEDEQGKLPGDLYSVLCWIETVDDEQTIPRHLDNVLLVYFGYLVCHNLHNCPQTHQELVFKEYVLWIEKAMCKNGENWSQGFRRFWKYDEAMAYRMFFEYWHEFREWYESKEN
jgi:hypothetical protein